MKKLYFLIFLSLILFGLAVVIVSRIHHSTEEIIAQNEEQWNQEKLELQDELTEISAKIEELKTQKTELDNPELDPQTLITRLQNMKDWSGFFKDKTLSIDERLRLLEQLQEQIREAFFIFQGLQNQKNRSLDAMRDYLSSGYNIVLYTYDANNLDKENVPETSRLGLIYVLGKIGTPEALKLLCQVMQGSSDLKEIMNAGNMLIAADKDAFSKAVLDVCKAHFPNLKREEQDKLLAYIRKISEESYKEIITAQTLYDENGKISLDNLRKKIGTLGESFIPEIYEAFNRPETTAEEKAAILGPLLKFAGSNEQVRSMFKGLINEMNEEEKDVVGSMFVMMFLADKEQNKEQRQQYLDFLGQWAPQEGDQSLFAGAVELARKALSQMIEQGDQFNSDEFQREALTSDLLPNLVKKQMDFFQKHPEWKGFSF